MLFKLAFRNVLRNRWRSLLTAGGIAVGVGLLIWTNCYIEGFLRVMIEGATAVEVGHAQIHDPDYAEEPSIYQHFAVDDEWLDNLEAQSSAVAVTPRVLVYGLIGNENRSQVANIRGVDPVREPRVSPVTDGIVEGRWLSESPPDYPAPREAVLGEKIADHLEVGVGDELVLFLQAADGSLGNDLLEVVGIVRTGSSAVDRVGVYMHIEDAQFIAALEGRAHEVAIVGPSIDDAEATALSVAGALGDEELDVRDWKDVLPELSMMLESSSSSVWIMYFFIYAIVALGVINTQRMSALERRREFGVLLAVGLKPRQLGAVIMIETILLAAVGGVLGLVFGGALSQYHSTAGLNIGAFAGSGDGFSFMGVGFRERIFFDVTASALIQPVVIVLFVAVFCGIWPAVQSMRIDAVQAIAGRT